MLAAHHVLGHVVLRWAEIEVLDSNVLQVDYVRQGLLRDYTRLRVSRSNAWNTLDSVSGDRHDDSIGGVYFMHVRDRESCYLLG